MCELGFPREVKLVNDASVQHATMPSSVFVDGVYRCFFGSSPTSSVNSQAADVDCHNG